MYIHESLTLAGITDHHAQPVGASSHVVVSRRMHGRLGFSSRPRPESRDPLKRGSFHLTCGQCDADTCSTANGVWQASGVVHEVPHGVKATVFANSANNKTAFHIRITSTKRKEIGYYHASFAGRDYSGVLNIRIPASHIIILFTDDNAAMVFRHISKALRSLRKSRPRTEGPPQCSTPSLG